MLYFVENAIDLFGEKSYLELLRWNVNSCDHFQVDEKSFSQQRATKASDMNGFKSTIVYAAEKTIQTKEHAKKQHSLPKLYKQKMLE